MVSSRTRKTTNVGTYLNDLDSRTSDVETSLRSADSVSQITDDRLSALENRVDNLSSVNYRDQQTLATNGSSTALALLDPAYRGPGPAKVSFFNDGTTTLNALSGVAYQWLGESRRSGNRVVEMTNLNGTWYILGHSGREQFGGKIRLPLGPNFNTYSKQTVSDTFAEPRAMRTHTGIVVVSGLIACKVGPVQGSTIVTLPAGYRPDTNLLFQVNNTSNARIVQVKPTGEIIIYSNNFISSSNDWIGLDGIAFPAAGVATWTDVGSGGSSYQNNWVAHDTANHGVPGFWKDPYGVVWWRGLIKGGTTGADVAMINMPATHSQWQQSHVITGASDGTTDGFGFVSAHAAASNGKIAHKPPTPSGWISLARLTSITPDAQSGLAWELAGYFLNSWTNYDPGFPSAQFVLRPDGFAMSQGLIKAGSIGANATQVPPYLRSERAMLFPTVSADAFGRMDIDSNNTTQESRGRVTPLAGSNAWFSLDGQKWMVE